MERCPDCHGEAIGDPGRGDGVCAECQGIGVDEEHNFIEGVMDTLSIVPVTCGNCSGTGQCPTCYGSGYVDM